MSTQPTLAPDTATQPARGTVALYRATAIFCIMAPAGFTVSFGLLSRRIDYPAVMNLPPAQVLDRVATAGGGVTGLWTVALATALSLVPLAVLVHQAVDRAARAHGRHTPTWLTLATVSGVLAAVFTALDLAQWVFLVPALAEHRAADPGASASTVAVYLGFHRLVGVGVGIYLATLCSGVWTFLAAAAMGVARLVPAWIAWLGMLAGVVLLLSIFQPAGFDAWAALNTAGFGLWSAWLGLAGLVLLLRSARWRGPA